MLVFGRLSLTHMIISCRDLVGSHRKMVQTRLFLAATKGWSAPPVIEKCPTLAVWALQLGGLVFQGSAPEPSPNMVLRAVWLVALVLQKVAPEPPSWPADVLIFAPMGWCSKSWGGVPKKLSQNSHSVYFFAGV